jgi:hypothetical protein
MKRKTFPTPKLIPLDLSLCYNKGERRGLHPEINSKDTYLALVDGDYYAGTFSDVWFGWTFDGWNGTSLQFDPPGTNGSSWQMIWKIVSVKKPRKVRYPEDKCQINGCKGRLKRLKSCNGDPDGIRADRLCRKCGQFYGCSKSSLFKISKQDMEME